MDEELKQQILTTYMATPEGRLKLAQSFFYPTRQRFEYREKLLLSGDFEVKEILEGTSHDISLGVTILAGCSKEELGAPDFVTMIELLDRIRSQHKLLTSPPPPRPIYPTMWDHLLEDLK